MQTLQAGYHGLRVMLEVNLDRVLYVATITVALLTGAFVGSVLLGL